MYVITNAGNNDGYGEPIAVANGRKEVESYIESLAKNKLSNKYDFDRIELDGEVREPYDWRAKAFCVKAIALKDGKHVIQINYEVFKVPEAKWELADFFGE